jgi:hypothetical protein
MSDVVQIEPDEPVAASTPQSQTSEENIGYHVVPSSREGAEEELFAFRAAMAAPEEAGAAQPEQNMLNWLPALGMAVAALACALLFVFFVPTLLKPKPPVLYIDMGNRRLDPAGLGGRLIARWEGSAAYQLSIDPLDQQQVARFQAVAEDPPHPLTFVIRLRDASGLVVCQKEILFPVEGPPGDPPYTGQAMQPRISPSGDTVQNVADADGKIAEISVTGGLPCPKKAYQHLAGWDFISNFPAVADQTDWLKHEASLAKAGKTNAGNTQRGNTQRFVARAQRLPAAIDGDDTIVGDNPLKGTVDTSGGRVFLVGANGLRSRSTEWQFFPAAIHFRCDKNGACQLTRANAPTPLQARLIR